MHRVSEPFSTCDLELNVGEVDRKRTNFDPRARYIIITFNIAKDSSKSSGCRLLVCLTCHLTIGGRSPSIYETGGPETMASSTLPPASPIQSSPSTPGTNNATPTETKKTISPGFSNTQDLVTILVGKAAEEQRFVVHKALACHYSPVFNSAFNGDFQEGQAQTYQLEDTSKGAVQLLVQWIYMQKLDLNHFPQELKLGQKVHCVAQLWVLADKLLIPRLQNAAALEIATQTFKSGKIPTWSLNYVYKNTGRGSPLRRLFIRLCAPALCDRQLPDFYTRYADKFPKEMLFELADFLTDAILHGTDFTMLKRGEYFRIVSFEVHES